MKRRDVFGLRVAGWAGLLALGVLTSSARGASSNPAAEEETSGGPSGRLTPAADAPNGVVVHEWGTFLGMNGSDGATLDGMYHEEHVLPEFVHGRARDQLRLPAMVLKGETPVIYFYTPRPVVVRVGVDFPRGVWTHWYPQATIVQPSLATQAESPDSPKNGRICWIAEVTPPSSKGVPAGKRAAKPWASSPSLPETAGDALWNFARDVDAAFVRTIDRANRPPRAEYERFLFYRGLGRVPLPMRAVATGTGSLSLEPDPKLADGVRHVFVLRVEGGRGAYTYRPAMEPGGHASGVIPSMDGARPLAEFTRAIADDLADKLTRSGLYAKEARAMVHTWKTSYFQSDGIRVLFVLPQSWTDAFIPMRIRPVPREVVRVMVGRLELLSPERERRAEEAVRDLLSDAPGRRHAAFAFLGEQGRYAEPVIHRVAATTSDEEVRTACRRLLRTEFVTDIRAAVHDAVDGKRIDSVPIELRAQLGRLYREMGMADLARAEATALWQDLRRLTVGPNDLAENSAIVRECRAAIYEALGGDHRAAETYAGRLRQRAASLPPGLDPNAIASLREWWVGRAYAGCLGRLGLVDSSITALTRELDRLPRNPDTFAERRTNGILLAFLLEARGERDRAEAQWSALSAETSLAPRH